MRTRKQIESDSKSYELLTLEVLLDIREILSKAPASVPKKRKPNKKKRVVSLTPSLKEKK